MSIAKRPLPPSRRGLLYHPQTHLRLLITLALNQALPRFRTPLRQLL